MENTLWKIAAILLALILMFIFPLSHMYERQDDITYNVLYDETNRFVETICNKGYITQQMYEDYIKKINSTGNIYDIDIEHQKKIYYPDPITPSEIVVEYESSFNYEILDKAIYNTALPASQRTYKMNVDDYFVIQIENSSDTISDVIKRLTFGSKAKNKLYVRQGGMIKNEDY